MKMLHGLLVALLVAHCPGAFAQWQWLDKDGRKVFSDRAPGAEIPEKNILKRPGSAVAKPAEPTEPTTVNAPTPPLPALSASKPGGDKALEAKKKQAEEAEATKRKSEEERVLKAKAENCNRAKQSKAAFDSGVRISRTTAAGEREVLDDAARLAEGQRIQGIIDSDCK
jgi:type IV secretory pathway VirB10-like protein